MTVEVRSEIVGMTKAQYDQAISLAGDQLRQAPGFLHHVAGPMDGGYRVTEIWESPEDFDRFIQENVMPLAEQIGIPPFEPKILPVDNVVTR